MLIYNIKKYFNQRGSLSPQHRLVPTKIFDIPAALLPCRRGPTVVASSTWTLLASLPTMSPSQSSLDIQAWSHFVLKWVLCGHWVSNRHFYQSIYQEQKLILRSSQDNINSFSYFQASSWLSWVINGWWHRNQYLCLFTFLPWARLQCWECSLSLENGLKKRQTVMRTASVTSPHNYTA